MKKLINEYMYWLRTVKISNFLNSLLHEVLGCAPTIILINHTSEILLVCTHYEPRQGLILLTSCMSYVAVPFAVEERSGTITVVDDISKFEHPLYDFEAVVTAGRDLTLVTNVTIHVVDDDRAIGLK